MGMLRRLALDLGIDVAVMGGFSALKAAAAPLFRGFMDSEAGKQMTGFAFDEVKSLLSEAEFDEQVIDEALPLLDDNEKQAWHDMMATFDPEPVAPNDPGYADYVKAVNEAIRLKEFYRRFTCKATKHLTAMKMKRDAGMTPLQREAYFASLDIRRKALERKYTPFLRWISLHGSPIIEKAGKGISENRIEANGKIENLASRIRDWADNL